MGKFDGILLCSDLDGTLLTTDKRVSDGNKSAIEEFMAEGGSFTFATGRVPQAARLACEYIVPNVPIICFNGAGIYDLAEDKLLWEKLLDSEAIDAVRLVAERVPDVGIVVCTKENEYYCRTNQHTQRHQAIEKNNGSYIAFDEIAEKWVKVIFMYDADKLHIIKDLLLQSGYADKYTFLQSEACYYELLPKGATKGEAMTVLAKMLDIDCKRTVGIGDSENDAKLVLMSGIGIAVANALPCVRDIADYITVDNNHDALKAVIDGLSEGRIHF